MHPFFYLFNEIGRSKKLPKGCSVFEWNLHKNCQKAVFEWKCQRSWTGFSLQKKKSWVYLCHAKSADFHCRYQSTRMHVVQCQVWWKGRVSHLLAFFSFNKCLIHSIECCCIILPCKSHNWRYALNKIGNTIYMSVYGILVSIDVITLIGGGAHFHQTSLHL